MQTAHKQLERDIIRALTEVCEQAKRRHSDFVWLTHEVDYQRFPQSLKVTLVFNEHTNDTALRAALRDLVGQVQFALEPVIDVVLPAAQIEARREHSLQS